MYFSLQGNQCCISESCLYSSQLKWPSAYQTFSRKAVSLDLISPNPRNPPAGWHRWHEQRDHYLALAGALGRRGFLEASPLHSLKYERTDCETGVKVMWDINQNPVNCSYYLYWRCIKCLQMGCVLTTVTSLKNNVSSKGNI